MVSELLYAGLIVYGLYLMYKFNERYSTLFVCLLICLLAASVWNSYGVNYFELSPHFLSISDRVTLVVRAICGLGLAALLIRAFIPDRAA